MKGYIEVDAYEDGLESLHKLKSLVCKIIRKLEQHLEEAEESRYA